MQNSKVLVSITAQEGFRKGLGCLSLSAARAVEKGFTCQWESDPARLSCKKYVMGPSGCRRPRRMPLVLKPVSSASPQSALPAPFSH